MKMNAGSFCYNPVSSGSELVEDVAEGVMGPISEIYFAMDMN